MKRVNSTSSLTGSPASKGKPEFLTTMAPKSIQSIFFIPFNTEFLTSNSLWEVLFRTRAEALRSVAEQTTWDPFVNVFAPRVLFCPQSEVEYFQQETLVVIATHWYSQNLLKAGQHTQFVLVNCVPTFWLLVFFWSKEKNDLHYINHPVPFYLILFKSCVQLPYHLPKHHPIKCDLGLSSLALCYFRPGSFKSFCLSHKSSLVTCLNVVFLLLLLPLLLLLLLIMI